MMKRLKEKIEDIYWHIYRRIEDSIYWIKGKLSILKYGFNIHDTWSLDYSMCRWLLPRLRQFKKDNIGFPSCKDLNGKDMTWEIWNYYLDLMIFWCERIANNDEPFYIEKEKINPELMEHHPNTYKKWSTEDARIAKRTFDLGEKCFHTYFHSLWW